MPINKVSGIANLWGPVVICAGAIFYFSSIPGPAILRIFSFQDLAYHFLIYLILGGLFSRALKKNFSKLAGFKILFFTFIFTILYGISDEFHQWFVPNRNVSVLDVLIDALGGLSGGLLYRCQK